MRLVERNRVWVAVKNFPTWLVLWRGLVTVADVPAGPGRVIKIFRRFGIGARDIALRD